MTNATLVILRHGQTDYNVKHLMTGQRDIPLNNHGEEQAREAGVLIKDIPFDKVYSSTLSRAFNTAALALKTAGQDLPIEQRKEIVEMDNGDFTGHSRTEDPVVANWPAVYDLRWPNGESLKDVVERVKEFFDANIAPRLERGENVLIVAHSVVLAAFEIALGMVDAPSGDGLMTKKKIPNAAPLVCDYEDGVLKSHHFIENPATAKAANQNTPPAKKNPRPRRPAI